MEYNEQQQTNIHFTLQSGIQPSEGENQFLYFSQPSVTQLLEGKEGSSFFQKLRTLILRFIYQI